MYIRRITVLAVLMALLVAACGSTTPSSSPGASNGASPGGSTGPSASPASVGGHYSLIGYQGKDVLLTLSELGAPSRSWIISINTTTSSWQAKSLPGSLSSTRGATDGKLIALTLGDSIMTEDAKGARNVLSAPADAKLPTGWGAGGLVALSSGGFAVRGAASLITVDAKGAKISVAALPAGSMLVAATSDPTRFLVAPTGSLDSASGLSLSLYNTTGAKSTALSVSGILSVSPSTAVGVLAYLRTATAYLALGTDGTTSTLASLPAGPSAVAADGTLLAVADCAAKSSCTLNTGAPGKLTPIDASLAAVAALALSSTGDVAILGPDPTTTAAPYFSVTPAKGKTVLFSLPTISLLTPLSPAASPSATPGASPSAKP